MKVKDVICSEGRSGYMHRDLAAIKSGTATPDGSLFRGKPLSPGFTRIIEPAIALSIVYVGADNLLAQGGRDVRAWIAFAFGFIHGFGFANVLREMDLPSRALGWSLFSFNVGVEIGQLAVVIGVAFLLAMLRSRSESAGRRVAFAVSLVVMAAGAFWFVQRVFFPA